MKNDILLYAQHGSDVRNKAYHTHIEQLLYVGAHIATSLQSGHKILYCGNGGSAAEAQHIAAELVGRFSKIERMPLPAIALTTDSSILTAIGNDYGFVHIFAKQIEAFANPHDTLIVSSTSGNSANILEAIDTAKRKGLYIVGLTGETGGKMATLCDVLFTVPTTHTPIIQEIHLALQHSLCEIIERTLFPNHTTTNPY